MTSRAASLLLSIVLTAFTATACAGESTDPGESDAANRSDGMAAVEALREDLRFAEAAQNVQQLLEGEVERSGDKSDAAKQLRAAYDELTRLQDLVDRVAQLKQAREYTAATDAARRVLALESAHYGSEHPNVTECRQWCESLRQADEAQQKAWAEIDDRVNNSLQQGRLDEAIGWTVALLKYKRKEFGNLHTEVAQTLIQLATLEERDGRAQTVVPRYEEAVRTLRTVLGPDHWRVAQAQLDLQTASQAARLGRADQLKLVNVESRAVAPNSINDPAQLAAELSRRQSDLALVEELVGTGNRLYITGLIDVGMLHRKLGRLSQADQFFQRATDLAFDVGVRSHPLFVNALSLQGVNRSDLADHAIGVGYSRQAAELSEELFGPYSEEYLIRLQNFANTLYHAGWYDESLPAHQKLAALQLEVRGRQHPETGTILADLANSYLANHDVENARKIAEDARQAVLESQGRTDRSYIQTLNLVASLEDDAGNLEQARRHYDELVDLARGVFGADHPKYARYLSAAAGHYEVHGEFERAAGMLEEVLAIQRSHLDENSSAQSERQQLEMADETRGTLFGYVTCCVELGDRQEPVYERLLTWKGAVSRQQALARMAARSPQGRQLQADLQQVAGELSADTFRFVGHFGIPERKVLESNWRRLNELQQELAAQAQTEQQSTVPTPKQLASRVPAHAALVDFCAYNHLIPDHSGERLRFIRELRLLAFVVQPDQPVRMVQLGPVAQIQSAADDWRALLQAGRGESSAAKGTLANLPQDRLRKLVWEPIATQLDDVTLLLICPDGPINDIPLAALPGSEAGRYLIDDFGFVTVPFAAWLMQEREENPIADETDESMLLVGDVDFGGDVASQAIVSRMASAQFVSLPGTAREVEEIGRLFSDEFPDGKLTTSSRQAASESFFRVAAPQNRFLHLATHGFCILEDPVLLKGDAERQEGDSLLTYLENYVPQLLSGIALADVNSPRENRSAALQDDGILTALELSTLDLSHVDVAVLSACETGLGQETTGEGMLGLQRALQIAGVGTAVTSLWKVDDAATQMLMAEFYRNLWQKRLSRSEALRQAQLTMLDSYDAASRQLRPRGLRLVKPVDSGSDRLPPYYWAAFCLSGAW